jgi:hypothetical protein
MFFYLFYISVVTVLFQAFLAYVDGYLTQKQMREKKINNGYSFIEHGGMWADVTIIPFAICYIVTRYELQFFSTNSVLLLLLSVSGIIVAGNEYRKMSIKIPSAHAHGGVTTLAGWVHAFYAIATTWIFLLFYLMPTNPKPSKEDVCLVTILLSIFFPLGVIMFSKKWKSSKGAIIQVAVSEVLLWLAAYRIM